MSDIQNAIDRENIFTECIVCHDEATFHASGKVNKHYVQIWGLQNPYAHIEHVRNSSKVNMFCAISHSSVYCPFFFDVTQLMAAVSCYVTKLVVSNAAQGKHLATRRNTHSLELPNARISESISNEPLDLSSKT